MGAPCRPFAKTICSQKRKRKSEHGADYNHQERTTQHARHNAHEAVIHTPAARRARENCPRVSMTRTGYTTLIDTISTTAWTSWWMAATNIVICHVQPRRRVLLWVAEPRFPPRSATTSRLTSSCCLCLSSRLRTAWPTPGVVDHQAHSVARRIIVYTVPNSKYRPSRLGQLASSASSWGGAIRPHSGGWFRLAGRAPPRRQRRQSDKHLADKRLEELLDQALVGARIPWAYTYFAISQHQSVEERAENENHEQHSLGRPALIEVAGAGNQPRQKRGDELIFQFDDGP